MYKNSENFVLNRNEIVKGNGYGQAINQPLDQSYAIEVNGDGNGIVLIFNNEGATTGKITILGSDDVFCGGDKEIIIPDAGNSFCYLEGAPYVQKSGEHKGKILLVGEGANIYFTCIEVL